MTADAFNHSFRAATQMGRKGRSFSGYGVLPDVLRKTIAS